MTRQFEFVPKAEIPVKVSRWLAVHQGLAFLSGSSVETTVRIRRAGDWSKQCKAIHEYARRRYLRIRTANADGWVYIVKVGER